MAAKPKKIGTKIDHLFAMSETISEREHELKELKSKRAELEADIIKHLHTENATDAGGKMGKVSISVTKHANVKDWKKYYEYIHKHKAFDLLQRRVSDKAYFDRIEEGEKIPGVEVYTREKLNRSRRREKV